MMSFPLRGTSLDVNFLHSCNFHKIPGHCTIFLSRFQNFKHMMQYNRKISARTVFTSASLRKSVSERPDKLPTGSRRVVFLKNPNDRMRKPQIIHYNNSSLENLCLNSKKDTDAKKILFRNKKTGGLIHEKRLEKKDDALSEIPSRFRLATGKDGTSGKTIINVPPLHSSWDSLNIDQNLLEAMTKGLEIPRANSLQSIVIPSILKKEQNRVLIASETGSGKTLAYLLPIFTKLKIEESKLRDIEKIVPKITYPEFLNSESRGKTRIIKISPKAILLVPSNELVDQVHNIAKTISHYCKLRVSTKQRLEMYISGRGINENPDILVATPAQLLKADVIGKKGPMITFDLDKVRHLVVDEGDTLLSADFGEEVQSIITECGNKLDTVVVSTATVPESLERLLTTMFPIVERIVSPRLHIPSHRARFKFINVQGSLTEKIGKLFY